MEIENKCFFSISLENGITITGQNPTEVFDYLVLVHYALADTCQSISSSIDDDPLEVRYLPKLRELRKEMFDAYRTISRNYHKERVEQ